MNILFVHFGDEWMAGSEMALLEMMRALMTKDVNPVLWCNAATMQDAARAMGISTHRGSFAHSFDYSSPPFSPRAYARLVAQGTRLIGQSGAELVHCNSAAPAQWMLPACRRRKVPMLVNLHSPYHRRSRYVLGLHLADRVVAVSSAVAAPLFADGMEPDRIAVVYNGFDSEALLRGDATSLREALDIPAAANVGVIAGSLIRRKGHDILFEAMRHVHIPFYLLVVGDGPERSALELAAAGLPVHFLGHRADLGAILRDAADFLIAPSRQEAFGRVIIDAAFAGIPAIGSCVDGIPEAIVEDVTGLLVPPQSPLALAEAITRLCADAPLRRRLGQAAGARARDLFTIETCAGRMLGEYREMLRRYRAPGSSRVRRLKPYWNLMSAAAH